MLACASLPEAQGTLRCTCDMKLSPSVLDDVVQRTVKAKTAARGLLTSCVRSMRCEPLHVCCRGHLKGRLHAKGPVVEGDNFSGLLVVTGFPWESRGMDVNFTVSSVIGTEGSIEITAMRRGDRGGGG